PRVRRRVAPRAHQLLGCLDTRRRPVPPSTARSGLDDAGARGPLEELDRRSGVAHVELEMLRDAQARLAQQTVYQSLVEGHLERHRILDVDLLLEDPRSHAIPADLKQASCALLHAR